MGESERVCVSHTDTQKDTTKHNPNGNVWKKHNRREGSELKGHQR